MYLYLVSLALVVPLIFLIGYVFRKRFDFTGKTVLITGGSRGLGLEIARELIKQGSRVAVCARDQKELDAAWRDLSLYGREIFTVRCDVTSPEEVEKMILLVEEEFGEIDVLINNAGLISAGPLEVMTTKDYETMMKIHFWGPLYTILAMLPRMERKGGGRIINIASIGGKISAPHIVPYSASKFALVGLSEGLAAEMRKNRIFVTTVCPGLMRTGSPYRASFKGQNKKEFGLFANLSSLPVFSIDSGRAAKRILSASKKGKTVVILTLPAILGAWFHGLFPGTMINVLAVISRWLPASGGTGTRAVTGKESVSEESDTAVTRRFLDPAAVKNNELSKKGLREAKQKHEAA